MRMSEEGLALIRRFEGFRGEAYRDPVGIWTIGFGHTSAAGPPDVEPGQRITEAEANAILARDVGKFAGGVRDAVKVALNDAQFAALVSFAYNVGLGAFRGSSVLKAVNAGEFEAVPRRLALWIKAGGRTLPGLVKRRAAEGEMFAGGAPPPDAPPSPPATPKRTLWGMIATVFAALIKQFRKSRNEGP